MIDYSTAGLRSRCLALGIVILLGAYLLLTSTVNLYADQWQYDVKRILELGLLPLIFTVVLLDGSLRSGLLQQLGRIPRWLAVALAAILALGVVSSAHNSTSSMSLMYSLAEVSLLTLLLLAALCVAACRQVLGPIFDQTAVVLIALVALTVGLQELLGVFAALNSGAEFRWGLALLHFSFPRFYNQVQTWSIPVIAALPLVIAGNPLTRVLCVAALALEWYVVLATGGRGSAVAVGLAILTAVVLLPSIRKTLIQYSVTGLLGGLLIYASIVISHQHLPHANSTEFVKTDRLFRAEKARRNAVPDVNAVNAKSGGAGQFVKPLSGARMWTSSGRIPLWRDALHEVQSNPLLGIGPMNYACTGPLKRAAHPHNFPLQFASEWGIPAILLLTLVCVFLSARLLRQLLRAERKPAGVAPVAAYLAVALLAAAIHACVSGVLVMPASQVTGVLICGWLLGLLPAPAGVRRGGRSSSLVLITGLALSIALLAFARQEMRVAAIRWEQTPVMALGIPRLWQNGKVCRLYRDTAFKESPIR